ncbi:MAG: hemerythrin domain-containing protein [Acidobacteriota bacterium]
MSEVIHLLESEHRVIQKVLRGLEGICRRIESGGSVERETLVGVVDFLRRYADRHHHAKEEAHLFPVLEQRGLPREGGPIGVMLAEHETGRALVGRMDAAAERGTDGDAPRDFAAAGRELVDHLSRHIEKEEGVLFPMAEDLLDRQTLETLVDWVEKADAESMSVLERRSFEQAAADLERTWSV